MATTQQATITAETYCAVHRMLRVHCSKKPHPKAK